MSICKVPQPIIIGLTFCLMMVIGWGVVAWYTANWDVPATVGNITTNNTLANIVFNNISVESASLALRSIHVDELTKGWEIAVIITLGIIGTFLAVFACIVCCLQRRSW